MSNTILFKEEKAIEKDDNLPEKEKVHVTNFVEAGFNAEGQSAILEIRKINSLQPTPAIPSFSITNLYYINEIPITTQSQHNDVPYDINLPPNALRFLICRIPPINTIIRELNDPNILTAKDFIKLGMHRTPSVDYVYVSKGTVTLYMGNNDVYNFKEGDAYAMRGADHAWINDSDSDCELVGVMIGVVK